MPEFPTLKFEVAFGVNPDTVPGSWTDLSDRLRVETLNWQYGREPGTGRVVLDNQDEALSPENSGSTFSPDVVPMTRCRMTATHNSISYPVFEGFVENWTPRLRGFTDLVVDVDVVDGFALLAAARTSVSFPLQRSGARISSLLDTTDWPSGRRELDTGMTTVQAYEASARIVLNGIRDTVEAEQGLLFIGPDGKIVFHDRQRRFSSDSEAVFGGATPDGSFILTSPRFAVDDIYNDIQVTPTDRGLQRAQDAASQSRFGHRWLSISDVPIDRDGDALAMAQGLLLETADPHLKIESMIVYGHRDDASMVQCLSRRVGDTVTVTPEYGPARDMFIESVDHKLGPRSWVTTWGLEAVSTFDNQWWILGTSQLGISTRLGW